MTFGTLNKYYKWKQNLEKHEEERRKKEELLEKLDAKIKAKRKEDRKRYVICKVCKLRVHFITRVKTECGCKYLIKNEKIKNG